MNELKVLSEISQLLTRKGAKIMQITVFLQYAIYAILILCASSNAQAVSEKKMDISARKADILEHALVFLTSGEIDIDTSKTFANISFDIEILDSITPFFHKRLSGKLACVINLDSVRIPSIRYDPSLVKSKLWNCKIYYDTDKEYVLKIQCNIIGQDINQSLVPPLSWSEYERDSSSFLGYIKEAHNLSFFEALDKMVAVNPFNAKEIIGIYTLYKSKYSDNVVRPVWYITLRGLPPKELYAPDTGKLEKILEWQEAYNIIDAITGEYFEGSISAK